MDSKKLRAWAPWVHALTISAGAMLSYWSEARHFEITRAAVIAAVVFGIARGGGWFLGRVQPRPIRHVSPKTLQQLEKLEAAINGDIHDLVNVLAILKADLGLAIDLARRRLEVHYNAEEAQEDEQPPTAPRK